MAELEKALGQFALYRSILARREPERVLFLAVPDIIVETVFQAPVGQLLLEDNLAQVVGFDPQKEEIVQWISKSEIDGLLKTF